MERCGTTLLRPKANKDSTNSIRFGSAPGIRIDPKLLFYLAIEKIVRCLRRQSDAERPNVPMASSRTGACLWKQFFQAARPPLGHAAAFDSHFTLVISSRRRFGSRHDL
jgi:hypothetical protein